MIALGCFYSLSSPWACLVGPQLQDIVRRHHVRLTHKPYDFQAVVPQTGGIVDGERFWGQDRLAFLDRALDRLRAR